MNYKEEIFLFTVQVLFLIFFAFLLKDILAGLIVSFFSRPLAKFASQWFQKNLKKKRNRK